MKSELLIEILSEEVPFSEQKTQQDACRQFFKKHLNADVKIFASPKRLILCAEGLESEMKIEAKTLKGPALNADERALGGFLKKCGDGVKIESLTQKNGFFWYESPAREVSFKNVLEAELIPLFFKELQGAYSKTMVWNASGMAWIRPIHNILCTFGGVKIIGSYAGIELAKHTFINGEKFEPQGGQALIEALKKADILACAASRLEKITKEIREIEAKFGVTCISGSKLIEENAYLTDYPTLAATAFEQKYLELPEKVLTLTLEKNQKYLLFKRNDNGKLANVAAICINGNYGDEAIKSIVEGNKKVLNARLEDAIYYIKIDERTPFIARNAGLERITFHQNFGSVFGRVQRMLKLAKQMFHAETPEFCGNLEAAIKLCKNDLTTEMVASFPELQGYIGGFYAQKAGFLPEVCSAIAESYKPASEREEIPQNRLACALALTEKYEKITSLLEAGEKPTSSRDPFGIRRDALGVIRLIIGAKLDVSLNPSEEIARILLDRFAFFMGKELEGEAAAIASKTGTKGALNFLKLHQLALDLAKFKQSLNGFKRATNFLKSPEARGFDAKTVQPEILQSSEEKELYSLFASGKFGTLLELEAANPLINKFFDENLIIDEKNPELTGNRLALIKLIEGNIREISPEFAEYYLL